MAHPPPCKQKLRSLAADTRGVTAIEYCLIVAAIGAGAVLLLGENAIISKAGWIYTMVPGLLASIAFGLGWGSYGTSLIYRLPRGTSLLARKPNCGSCKKDLEVRDLFPVFSYPLNRGKCRFCGAKIPPSLFYSELYMVVVFMLAWFAVMRFNEAYILLSHLGICVVVLTFIFYEHGFVERRMVTAAAMLGITYRILQDGALYTMFYSALIALLVGVGIRELWIRAAKKDRALLFSLEHFRESAMEGKFSDPSIQLTGLMAVIGLWLSPVAFGLFLFLCVVLWLMLPCLWKSFTSAQKPLPFAVIMLAAWYLAALLGQ